MEFIKGLAPGQARSAQAGASGSLLGQWNSYSASSDVEAGTSSQTPLLQSIDEAGTTVSNFFKQSVSRMGETVSGVQSSVSGLGPTSVGLPGLFVPSGQQLTTFFILEGIGAALLFLAFMVFAPLIVLTPSKFALSFTMGCLSVFSGFAALRGVRQQLQHMASRERLPMSAAYVASIVATLYSALVLHSYIACILCSGLQVVAMLFYILSYFPGGASGVKFVLSMLANAVMSCFSSVGRMAFR